MKTLITLIMLGTLVACSKPEAPAPQESAATPQPTGLAAIPGPDPSKYPSFHNLKEWKNPYLVVREGGIGFVDSANSEVRILKPEEVPALLNSLPETAWPYGRVVMVGQVKPEDPSNDTKAQLRKNRGLLVGTLRDLKVLIYEAPQD